MVNTQEENIFQLIQLVAPTIGILHVENLKLPVKIVVEQRHLKS